MGEKVFREDNLETDKRGNCGWLGFRGVTRGRQPDFKKNPKHQKEGKIL